MNSERFIRGPSPSPSRVVTLAFLSKRLPASVLAGHISKSLHVETGASVVLVRLLPGEVVGTTTQQRSGNLALEGNLSLPAQLPRTEEGFHLLNLEVNNELYPLEWIESLVEQLRRRFRHVLIEAVTDDLQAASLFAFLLCSDVGYLFVQPRSEDVYHLDLLSRELRQQPDSRLCRLKPVLCLRESEQVGAYDKMIENALSPVSVFIRGCPEPSGNRQTPTGWFKADIRRLARELGDCLVGLALSSGAAKGLSHIGVIQVLEENGIEVDVVAGSSMGAYIGAIWAYGHDGQELEKLAREMEGRWTFWSIIDPVFPPRQGFVRGVALKRRLMKSIGDFRFAELPRPLRVMATNLETLERVVFSSGEVATAVHASTAVPGICVPVKIDGETYIDGGIVDPLPVDVLREMGVNRIIAVNAIPTPDRIRYSLRIERELAHLSPKRARAFVRKWLPVEEHLNYFARGNILEILMRSIHGAQMRMAESLGRQADIVLRPEISDDRWLDFRSPGRFIKPGRQIAERYLAEIKTLVTRKSVEHETPFEHMASAA